MDAALISDNRHLGIAAKRYAAMENDREDFLRRAKNCSRLTIPALIPDSDETNETLPSLFQSTGAGGVTNLASKLLMTMLPPNEPCFKLQINNMVTQGEEEQVDKEYRTKIDKALSRMEQTVLADIEEKGDRSVVFEANQHLIVGGNVLFYDDPDAGLRMFPLSRYVVSRDHSGTPVEIIVKETIALEALDEETRLKVIEASKGGDNKEGASSLAEEYMDARQDKWLGKQKEVDLYTRLVRDNNIWKINQECYGVELEGSKGQYRAETCPWFPVRMYSVAGENYGRSFVEQVLGDLTSLESLKQALVEGSAISAFAIGLVNPNGTTSARAIAEARNGDIIEGNLQDVNYLQVQKAADLRVAFEEVRALETSLKTSFLMMEGVRRQGERVTAEEIRTIARELEAGLGGVYTLVSQEFQLPFIRSRMKRLTSEKKLPELPKDTVSPTVVTGFEALGRGNDKQKLMEYLSVLQQFGEQAYPLLHVSNALQRLASAMGIATEGLIKTQEEIEQEQQAAMQQQQQMAQQQQQAQVMQSVMPEAVRQIGNNPEMAQAMMGQMGQGGV